MGKAQLWEWGRDGRSQEGTGLQLLSFQQQVILARAAMSKTTGVLRISRGLKEKTLPPHATWGGLALGSQLRPYWWPA